MREAKEADIRRKGGMWMKGLEPMPSEDFPPSNYPQETLNFGRNQRKPNGIKRKMEGREEVEEERNVK